MAGGVVQHRPRAFPHPFFEEKALGTRLGVVRCSGYKLRINSYIIRKAEDVLQYW